MKSWVRSCLATLYLVGQGTGNGPRIQCRKACRFES
jgi:hypothetical protein